MTESASDRRVPARVLVAFVVSTTMAFGCDPIRWDLPPHSDAAAAGLGDASSPDGSSSSSAQGAAGVRTGPDTGAAMADSGTTMADSAVPMRADRPDGAGADGSTITIPAGCKSDELLCGGKCVLATDPKTCGSCNHDCTNLPHVVGAAACANAACSVPPVACASGWAHCSSNPDDGCEVDISTPKDCGACSQACSSSSPLCAVKTGAESGFECTVRCTAPSTVCGSSCVDTNNDANHCGGCNMRCGSPASHGQADCTKGTCGHVCNPSYSACGEDCVDLANDRANCGACGHDCGADPTDGQMHCINKTCTSQCNPGYHLCGASCVADADASQCGLACVSCAAPSGGSVSCDGVQCVASCPAGYRHCAGACLKAPASPSELHYVDPVQGTDDPAHGAGFGTCGYKTLTYALTQATGQIALQTATYTPATEAFPIVLKGSQALLCKYLTAGQAAIQGKGLYAPIQIPVVVAFQGSQNALYDCVVNGGGGTGYCVDINSSGTSNVVSHMIAGADISNCGGSAVNVEKNMSNVTVSGSRMHDSLIGIFWTGTSTGASFTGNTFSANSTDVQCELSDVGVTGSANISASGAKPSCSTCGNCPF